MKIKDKEPNEVHKNNLKEEILEDSKMAARERKQKACLLK
jgi:hypothetical protein